MLRPLVNQPDIMLFMATFGLTYFLIGLGELVFGGNPKVMIAQQLFLPSGAIDFKMSRRLRDAAEDRHRRGGDRVVDGRRRSRCSSRRTRIGRALRAVADNHQAALSVGISLEQIWVIVWFAAGIVALATGIMWGARSDVSFALQVIALKALPVLILGGFTSIPGAIVGGLIIGVGEKLGEFYWGPLLGGGIESWLAYVIALGLPAVPAAGPVRRERSSSGFEEATSCSTAKPAVQDQLRGRHGDLSDPPGPDRPCADPARRLRRRAR